MNTANNHYTVAANRTTFFLSECILYPRGNNSFDVFFPLYYILYNSLAMARYYYGPLHRLPATNAPRPVAPPHDIGKRIVLVVGLKIIEQ